MKATAAFLFILAVQSASGSLLRSLSIDGDTPPTYERPSDRPLAVCKWFCPQGYQRRFNTDIAPETTCTAWKHGFGKCVDTERAFVGEICADDNGCRGSMTCDGGTCNLPLPRPEACVKDLGTCDWYKSCLAPAHRCDTAKDEYAVSYGHRFCSGFFKHLDEFTPFGQQWVKKVCTCLTSALVPTLDKPARTESECSALRTVAFDSHPDCYTGKSVFSPDRNLSICKMIHTKDLPTILRITAEGFFNAEGARQIVATAKTCASQITGYAIDHISTINVRVQQGEPKALGMEKAQAFVAKAAQALKVEESRIHLAINDDGERGIADLELVITAPEEESTGGANGAKERVRSSVELKEELSQLLASGALDDDDSIGGQVRVAEEIKKEGVAAKADDALNKVGPVSAATGRFSTRAIPMAIFTLVLLAAALVLF